MNNIVLLGPPGAGKGTQAEKLEKRLNIPHISTGDIFRENIKNMTEIGKLAKSYIDKGMLVPDEVTVAIVKDRLSRDDVKNGFLLDGFPRNVFQAEELKKFMSIDYCIDIEVDFDKLLGRITGRRICNKCGGSYHIDFIPNKEICPKCGNTLTQRADDNEVTVKSRLEVYSNQTKPLVDFYEKEGVLHRINGDLAIDDVFNDIIKVVG